MFLPRKSFCKTKTLLLVKKKEKNCFASCDENATNPYILPVTQNTAVCSWISSLSIFFQSDTVKTFSHKILSSAFSETCFTGHNNKAWFPTLPGPKKPPSISNPCMLVLVLTINATISNPCLAACLPWKTDHN